MIHSRDDPVPVGVSPERRKRHLERMRKLRNNREGLEQELIISKKHDKMMNDPKLETNVKSIESQIDSYTKKIQILRQSIFNTENQISKAREHRLHQKLTKGGVKATKKNNQIMAKQIRILENRLEKLLEQFNKKINENKMLRERINLVRKDRSHYDLVFKKMEVAIHKFDRMTKDARKRADEIGDLCEKDRIELESIVQGGERRTLQFESKWRERQDAIEHQLLNGAVRLHKMRETMSQIQRPKDHSLSAEVPIFVGSIRSSEEGAEESALRCGANTSSVAGDTPSDGVDTEDNMKSKIAHKRWTAMHHKMIVRSQGKKLENFIELFKQLENATGVSDPDQLADQMKASENYLFSIFKHTSQLEKDIEDETAQMHRLKTEIRQLLPRGDSKKGGTRYLVEQLQDKLRDTKHKTKKYLESARDASRELHSLDGPIARLLTAASLLDLGDSEMLDDRSSGELPTRAKATDSGAKSNDDDVRDFLLLNKATSNPSFRASTMMEQLGMIEMRVRAYLMTSEDSKGFTKQQNKKAHMRPDVDSTQKEKMSSALANDAIFSDAFETPGATRNGDYDAEFIPLSVKQTRGAVDRYFTEQRQGFDSEAGDSKRERRSKDGAIESP